MKRRNNPGPNSEKDKSLVFGNDIKDKCLCYLLDMAKQN